MVALSFLPPAVAGYTLERQIEAHGWAGRGRSPPGSSPERWRCWSPTRRPQERGPGDARASDGLALGLAQAAALIPGVSRNGATLTAARARRFTREHANLLSRTVALPVIVGATVLKGVRLRRRGVSPELARAMAAGVGASFVVDARLAAADRPGRARPRAVAVRRLPDLPGDRGRGQNGR